jgi:SAM-dependent methyltransferase
MGNEPETWHYGIVAQFWAEFCTEGPEIAYFRRSVERHGQPALDVACGTGRLLLPMLRACLDVDGCDVSADMLAHCRAAAERERLSPRLYEQAMHRLEMPRLYRTIFVCGGLGLGGDRDQDCEALRRMRQHLSPGGTLVLDHHVPYAAADQWSYWVAAKRRELPEPPQPLGEGRLTSDGSEIALQARIMMLDPLEQLVTLTMRAERRRDGRLVEEEERVLKMRYYFRNELLLMLERAGFAEVAVSADYADDLPTPDSKVLVFTAK